MYSLFDVVKCARCKLADTFRFIDWITGFHLGLVHSARVVSFMRLSTAEKEVLTRDMDFYTSFQLLKENLKSYSKYYHCNRLITKKQELGLERLSSNKHCFTELFNFKLSYPVLFSMFLCGSSVIIRAREMILSRTCYTFFLR